MKIFKTYGCIITLLSFILSDRFFAMPFIEQTMSYFFVIMESIFSVNNWMLNPVFEEIETI
jgi:hypothetical protein